MIAGLFRGLLLKVSPDQKEAALEASWPEPLVVSDEVLEKALFTSREGDTRMENYASPEASESAIRMYHPIVVSEPDGPRFVLVLEIEGREKQQCAAVQKILSWNSEWMKFALASVVHEVDQGLVSVFKMAVACLEKEGFQASATVLVSALVEYFDCQRVCLGLRKGRHMQVQVLSHSTRFKQEANLVQSINAAMDEAVDQDAFIVYPHGEVASKNITRAHEELAGEAHMGTICTLPLSEAGTIVGALTFERGIGLPFTEAELRAIEQIGALMAPVLALRHRDEWSLPAKAWDSVKKTAHQLLGPQNIRLKLFSAIFAALVLFFSFAKGDWRVTADAVVEGRVQRTVSAAIDGYIASVEARAGDLVEAGQQMGTLDDRDLRLQRLKWSTLRQQLVSESREAMAGRERAEVNIISAKIEQADAELKLIDEQLSRTVLLAPYDGIVIEGDLSQLLGTPVSRGDPLFKVAPLRDYRIILNVSEQDIVPVAEGQAGRLILASMPGQPLDIRITRLTPVSVAEGGSNYFRVEASLDETDLALQPGMEGVGKVDVGRANLFWLWTRDLVNWARLQAWTWSR